MEKQGFVCHHYSLVTFSCPLCPLCPPLSPCPPFPCPLVSHVDKRDKKTRGMGDKRDKEGKRDKTKGGVRGLGTRGKGRGQGRQGHKRAEGQSDKRTLSMRAACPFRPVSTPACPPFLDRQWEKRLGSEGGTGKWTGKMLDGYASSPSPFVYLLSQQPF